MFIFVKIFQEIASSAFDSLSREDKAKKKILVVCVDMHVHFISSFPVAQNQIDKANFAYVGFFFPCKASLSLCVCK